MLPIFPEELFGGLWRALVFVKSRGKRCPFFWRNFSVALVHIRFLLKAGGNAAHFLEEFLGAWTGVWLRFLKQGEVVPFFWRMSLGALRHIAFW